MNGITLITKEKIEGNKINKIIIDNFPFSKKITSDDNDEIFLGEYPDEFYIVYKEAYAIDSELSTFEEDIKSAIPFKSAICTYLLYRNIDSAKSAIASILTVYPELFIYDEINDWIGPASDFLK